MLMQTDVFIPQQRTSEPVCHRCGASGVRLEPDLEVPGKLRCSETWHGCYAAWRPHCPVWCDANHSAEHEKPFRERVWFHHSAGIEVITGERANLLGRLRVDLCAFERVGGGLETPTININDDCMLPAQARAFASALIASAQLADMSGATFAHGEAYQRFED